MDERRDSGEYYPGGRSGGETPPPPAPAVTVDDEVTKESANPVKSSGIWSAIWGALEHVPGAFTSLYDWCAAQLAGKRDYEDLTYSSYGEVWSGTYFGDDVVFVPDDDPPQAILFDGATSCVAWKADVPDDGGTLRLTWQEGVTPVTEEPFARWTVFPFASKETCANATTQDRDAVELSFGSPTPSPVVGRMTLTKTTVPVVMDRIALVSEVPTVPTPDAPSTDPASQGKPADAYFTGTALAGKLSTSGGTMTGPLDIVNNTSDGTHGLRIVEGSEFGRRYDAEYGSEGVSLYDQGTKIAYINFPRNGVTREDQFALASQITGKADKSEMSVTPGTGEDADKTTIQLKSGTAATVLTQHQDISGKADSSALRYDLVTAQIIQSFSADSLPVAFTYNEVPYSISTIVSESDATHAGDLFIAVKDDGQGSITGYSLVVVLVPATGSESALLLEVAYFNADGTYNSGLDATFGGEEPVANTSPVVISVCALADRANNAVTLAVDSGDVTLVLPPAVPGKVRDLLVRVELPTNYLTANNKFDFVGASGETIVFESEDGVMPYPEDDGTYWFSLTESKPPTTVSNDTTYTFAVSMKPLVAVTQGGS